MDPVTVQDFLVADAEIVSGPACAGAAKFLENLFYAVESEMFAFAQAIGDFAYNVYVVFHAGRNLDSYATQDYAAFEVRHRAGFFRPLR
jgi:hypothetical protein